jgi:hypothetical protein
MMWLTKCTESPPLSILQAFYKQSFTNILQAKGDNSLVESPSLIHLRQTSLPMRPLLGLVLFHIPCTLLARLVRGLGPRLGVPIWAGAFFLPFAFGRCLGFALWSFLCVSPFPFWIGAFSFI